MTSSDDSSLKKEDFEKKLQVLIAEFQREKVESPVVIRKNSDFKQSP
jgi:hypothetical protein